MLCLKFWEKWFVNHIHRANRSRDSIIGIFLHCWVCSALQKTWTLFINSPNYFVYNIVYNIVYGQKGLGQPIWAKMPTVLVDRALLCNWVGQPWPGGQAMAPFALPLYLPLSEVRGTNKVKCWRGIWKISEGGLASQKLNSGEGPSSSSGIGTQKYLSTYTLLHTSMILSKWNRLALFKEKMPLVFIICLVADIHLSSYELQMSAH